MSADATLRVQQQAGMEDPRVWRGSEGIQSTDGWVGGGEGHGSGGV